MYAVLAEEKRYIKFHNGYFSTFVTKISEQIISLHITSYDVTI